MDMEALAAELEEDEGLRLKPYRDSVGKTTIGVGRNLDDVGISSGEARMLLLTDMTRVCGDLDGALPWWRGLNDDRQRVLANMAFNMGIQGLLGFRWTLSLIQQGRYEDAAHAMLMSKWAGQVGDRAQRLAARMRGQDGPMA